MNEDDNSLKEAEFLFELIKTKIKDGSLRLFYHREKRKYVELYPLRNEYKGFKIIEDKCGIQRNTSTIFGGKNEGLNRDGWKFIIVGTSPKAREISGEKMKTEITFVTWFKNRHTAYESMILEEGWNHSSVYLNINNRGVEFALPKKLLIDDYERIMKEINK